MILLLTPGQMMLFITWADMKLYSLIRGCCATLLAGVKHFTSQCLAETLAFKIASRTRNLDILRSMRQNQLVSYDSLASLRWSVAHNVIEAAVKSKVRRARWQKTRVISFRVFCYDLQKASGETCVGSLNVAPWPSNAALTASAQGSHVRFRVSSLLIGS